MTILSEATIKVLVEQGQLIRQGSVDHVRGSSYACHAARVFPGGPGEPGIEQDHRDWTAEAKTAVSRTDFYRIAPRQIVWVRIREALCLPDDTCAFRWQTNSLSRKGLLLLNMSMVDPGYEGHLACLFVNFGREPVDIDPGTTVARLVFQKIEGKNPPYPTPDDEETYDRRLREAALHGPSSFLSFQEFQTTFAGEKEKALAEFTRAKDQAIVDMKAEVANQVKDKFRENTDDLPKFLRRSYAVAFAGIALLTLALTGSHWVVDALSPKNPKDVATAVDADLGRRFGAGMTYGIPQSDGLEQRVRQLEVAIRDMTTPPAPIQAPSGKSDAGH